MRNQNILHRKGLLRQFLLVLTGVFALAVSSCDYNFEPLQENDRFFYSMYGVLNTSDDRQWIRVTPIRESLFLDDAQIDARVTLTKNSTGQTVELRDSLFEFYATVDDIVNVRNFYTDLPIEFGEEYTIRAERSDGMVSMATTRVPQKIDAPTFSFNPNTLGGIIQGNVQDRIVVADVEYSYVVIDENGIPLRGKLRVSQLELDRLVIDDAGDYKITVNDRRHIADEFGVGQSNVSIDSAEIFIAISGDDWPVLDGTSSEESALPQSATNVANGTGLVLGVSSLTLPFESCYDSNNQLTPCPPKNSNRKVNFSLEQ